MAGPLAGIRVLELSGLGPVPHATMMLADLGADCVTVERPGTSPLRGPNQIPDHLLRGRRRVVADLKSEDGLAQLMQLVEAADVLLEGYRPGVTERLGFGPEVCLERNPRLIYARVTGWGQSGPLAAQAGHDINYLGLTGVLSAVGIDRPEVPLNLVGDYGGGSMLALSGVLAALLERVTSGRGQVLDVAMVDGISLLMQIVWSRRPSGEWNDHRASNALDGGAPFYCTYACNDGGYMAVGALEDQFYERLVKGLSLELNDLPPRSDRDVWPQLRRRFAQVFATRSRDEWTTHFADRDACVTPVLGLAEVPEHPHLMSRRVFVSTDGVDQPAGAPRFSRSSLADPKTPSQTDDTESVFADWCRLPS